MTQPDKIQDADLLPALQAMPLFEDCTEAQLEWLIAHTEVVQFETHAYIFQRSHSPADFWVLIEGEWQVTWDMNGFETTLARTDAPGTWGGFIPWISSLESHSAQVLRPSRMLRIAPDVIKHMLVSGFPVAPHILAGLSWGVRSVEGMMRQQEKLTALGRLSAGLAHELNNPAAAGRRAAASLRERTENLRGLALHLGQSLAPAEYATLTEREHDLLTHATATPLTPLERSEQEEVLADWMTAVGVANAWDLAPSLAHAGIDRAWLEDLATTVPHHLLNDVLCYLEALLATAHLVDDLEDSTASISKLVQAIKAYTYMDQAPWQEIDIHRGIEDTLTIFGSQLTQGVQVVRDYDPDLPRLQAYGGELNQVWTNLIDNALTAMQGQGQLTIRTSRDGERVLIEMIDDGPGIPPDIQDRIWEPFFTTKDVGEGTGMGLDTVQRIITRRHDGTVRVTSQPGATCFQVRLPIR